MSIKFTEFEEIIKETEYNSLPLISTGPFNEISEEEFDKIIEMVGE